MNKPKYYSYTATFTQDNDGWLVEFPDLDRCVTNADTLDEAVIQANNILEDYMAILEHNHNIIPEATPYDNVEAPIKKLIVVQMQEARLRWQETNVRRIVILPAWIEQKAAQDGLNLSRILKSALISKFKKVKTRKRTPKMVKQA